VKEYHRQLNILAGIEPSARGTKALRPSSVEAGPSLAEAEAPQTEETMTPAERKRARKEKKKLARLANERDVEELL
jgi:hypothetical protein